MTLHCSLLEIIYKVIVIVYFHPVIIADFSPTRQLN